MNVFIIGVEGRVAKRHALAWNKLGWDIYGCGSKIDYRQILKKWDDIDIVDICTPIYLHAQMIDYCVKLGYPVICEKPMAINEWDAWDLTKLDGKIGIVYQFRYNPKIIKLRKELKEQKYGEIKMVTANYFRWRGEEYYKKWEADKMKAGGGVLFNVCIHYVDLLQWLFGYPTEVKGMMTTTKQGLDVEDNLAAIMRFPNGGIGTLNLSTHVEPPKHFELSVYGTKGNTTIQLRENEYHYRFFEEFIKDGDYVKPIEAYKSYRIIQDIYANCSNS
jgi:UDP-N-acetyl-2-amino-2-deoxyglucuronate dehydrogenase